MTRTKVDHPLFARIYARLSPRMEEAGFGARREHLLEGLEGRVVEVGCGDGMNFRHYPVTVSQVLALEPEPHLRAIAERRAREAATPVEVVDSTADAIPARDGAFDAAVVSLVLCSVADAAAALREIRRVLRDGGQLRFLEHVKAGTRGLARAQRLVDATFWPLVAGGCHSGRDTVAAIRQAGFAVDHLDEFRWPGGRVPSPTAPHVLGRATRSAGTPPSDTSTTDPSATDTAAIDPSATDTSATDTSATDPSATDTAAIDTAPTETPARDTPATKGRPA